MKKILVADDLEDVRDIIVMMIEAEFDLEIFEASDGEQALSILKQNPDISIVVCDYDMPKKNGGHVYQYTRDTLNKPFILVSGVETIEDENLDGFKERVGNYKIAKPFEHEVFSQIIAKALNNLKEMENSSQTSSTNQLLQSQVTGYFRIKGQKLQSHIRFIADTYIKLSEEKFIKIGDKDSAITPEQIQRYRDKNIEYFYLNKEQFNDFLNTSIKNLLSLLENNDLNLNEAISLHLTSIKQVQEVVKTVGVKQPVIDLTDKVASSVNKTLLKEKNLKSFLKDIVKKENYFFEHTNIINYLCGAMVKELGWDKERATKRFITVSMFIDIALSDPKLATIQSLSKNPFPQLETADQNNIKQHVKNSIDIISKSKSIIGDEFKIIEQHHEKPDESGFPKGLNAKQIPPQSAVFILAHDFAYQLIKNGGPEKISPEQIFDILGNSYSDGNFEKPYLALKKALDIQ